MQKYYFFLILANIHSILLADMHFLSYFECTPRKRVPPRSYFRSMRYILQFAQKIIRKIGFAFCTDFHSHYHEQAPIGDEIRTNRLKSIIFL